MMNRINMSFPTAVLRFSVQRILLSACFLCYLLPAVAQEEKSDTVVFEKERRSNQNVLLNASSATQPRFISLGMPQWGTHIMEDGLPCSTYSDYFPGFWSWHSGLGTESMQVTTLDESALQLGEAGFFASSTSKTGAERLEAQVDYTLNQYGRNVIDVLVATPLKNGWGLSLNAMQDLDRGSNHLDASYLQQHIKYYKAGVQKKFENGIFKGTYQYMDSYIFNDTFGPFIFVGDGSVKSYDGFSLGHDQYLPPTPTFDYIDVKTGEKRTKSFSRDCGIPMHTATLSLDYLLPYDIQLEARTHLKVGRCDLAEPSLSSIDRVIASDGYTYMDGTPYVGYVQTRYMTYHDAKYLDNLTTLILKKQFNAHSAQVGANIWITKSCDYGATNNFAYEAKADPQSLYYHGQQYFVYNTSALYCDGRQSRLAIFGQDQWAILPQLNVRAGVRLEYSGIRGNASNNVGGDTNNTRIPGWNLTMLNVTKTPMDTDMLNGAFTLVGTYRLNDAISFEANAIATQQHSEMWQYYDAAFPSQTPRRTYLLRAGVNYKNNWLDLQSLLTYNRRSGNYNTALWTHELTQAAGGFPAGYNETLFVPSLYGMHGFGWTTDVLAKSSNGFSFHGLLTVRAPRYRNYKFTPSFSDGYSQTFDFSGKSITTTPAVELELEPSYEWEKWRVWLSARFYSKQYVNITNSLYFNPRWETFAGVDFTLNKHLAFSLNVVNLLNQKGASAGIQEASLATDASAYSNYLTSGTFIRPFTLEFKTSLKL